jgi:hypothetical protein
MSSNQIQRWLKTWPIALASLALLTPLASNASNESGQVKGTKTRMSINAGTVFNLNANGPLPWSHQVRGIVQVSNLGNCKVFFAVKIHDGSIPLAPAYPGGHLFRLSGTMAIMTMTGDELQANVEGWADPDPADPTGSMFTLYYGVTITGGTGKLAGASGTGDVDGAFLFANSDPNDDRDDAFCAGYAGSATWHFDGWLVLPKQKK